MTYKLKASSRGLAGAVAWGGGAVLASRQSLCHSFCAVGSWSRDANAPRSRGATVRRGSRRDPPAMELFTVGVFSLRPLHTSLDSGHCRLHSRAGSPPHIRFAREKCRARGVPYLTRLVHASRAPALRMREFTPGGGTHTYLPVQACVKASARQAFDRALGVRA